MSRTFTVSQLATKIRVRGDYENSEFISDSMLIDFIDSAHTEVYDLLVTKWENYFLTEVEVSTIAGTSTIPLPADFYKLMGVDINKGGIWTRLFRYTLHERNSYQSGLNTYRGSSYKYRLQGDSVTLIPTPSGVDTIKLTYVPAASVLSALTDTADGVNGWEELIVLFALRRCQVREETSTSAVDSEIARQVKRIEVAADARDSGEPESLQDLAYSSTSEWSF